LLINKGLRAEAKVFITYHLQPGFGHLKKANLSGVFDKNEGSESGGVSPRSRNSLRKTPGIISREDFGSAARSNLGLETKPGFNGRWVEISGR